MATTERGETQGAGGHPGAHGETTGTETTGSETTGTEAAGADTAGPRAWSEESREHDHHTHDHHTPVKEPPGESPVAALLADPRVRRWQWPAAAAAAAGAAAWALTSWRVGLAVAILVIVGESVRRSRKSSSVTAWQKSSAAERRTEKQLRTLQRNGFLVLHARAVPHDDGGVSDGRIDHLVIGPSGVYAIDSEKWDKRLPVRTMSHLKLFHGPFNKKDRLDEARWEAQYASSILGQHVGFEVAVQPSVAIYGPSIPWKVMRVRDVDVYAGNRARAYLRRRPKILTEGDVQRIFQAAEKALPPKYPESTGSTEWPGRPD